MKKPIIYLILLLISHLSYSQIDSTDNVDYGSFGEAEGVKRYCTIKVLNQTPQRILSLGYEQYGQFNMPNVYQSINEKTNLIVGGVNALRAQINIPIISNNRLIWQLGTNYWGSKIDIQNPGNNLFANYVNATTLVTSGLNSTIFKPINERNFLLFQTSADLNGFFHNTADIESNAWTYSGTLIYGWKTSEKNMVGVGLARTYRAGRLMYIPVLLWNKTFNDRLGMELLLPAKAYLRYNFSTSSILQAGFELEGNQYLLHSPISHQERAFLQRGELKPRIMWDKKLSGFLWINAQIGLRYNYRFDVMNTYNATLENNRIFSSDLGNPFFFNLTLNFVSP
jgi:hypothetical protein